MNPTHQPAESVSVLPKVAAPAASTQQQHFDFHSVAQCTPDIAREKMITFFEGALERLRGKTNVTTNIDDEGVHQVYLGSDFQISLIYSQIK